MKSELFISEHLLQKIKELTDAGNEPFYIYDKKVIQVNCQKFLDIPYYPLSVHFAMMANSNPQFLKIIRDAGLKVFVNSLMHLDISLDLGFRGSDIVFAASAMSRETMKRVQATGAKLILDSAGQLELWQSLFPDTPVGIRCNIGEAVIPKKTTGGYFIGNKSRLGLTPESVDQLRGNPAITGLHLYVGTNIRDISYFFRCYEVVIKMVQLFPNLGYLDFGGGFGVGEKKTGEFNMGTYSRKVSEMMRSVSDTLGRPTELILEPGRIIGADSGYFVCRIEDIKMRNNKQLIGVNASCVQFPRPLFYPETAFHPVFILNNMGCNSEEKELILSSVYGCSTYSRDFLAREVMLPPAHNGDLVILGNAGSYCSAAHTSFLGFPKAEEYFV